MGQYSKPGNPQAYAFKTGDTIVNGAFAVWDPTATAVGQTVAHGAVRPLSAGIGSSGAFLLGVFNDSNPTTSNLDNGNPQYPYQKVLVDRAGIFPFKSTNSETYVHGTAVYAAAAGDNLTITTSSSSNTLVGYVNLPDGSSVTGAAGVNVNVEFNANTTYETNSLLSA